MHSGPLRAANTAAARARQPASKWGAAHKRLRARLMHSYRPGVTTCWRCGKPIDLPPSRVHLGHDDTGTRWMGLEHPWCNEAAGARVRAARARADSGAPEPERLCGCGTPFRTGGRDLVLCPDCRRAGQAREPSGRAW